MGKSDHDKDAKALDKKHKQVKKSTEGGACLSRHDAARAPGKNGKLKEHSCNHRWQAFKKAETKKLTYKWTKRRRDALGGAGAKVKVVARCKSGWVTATVPQGDEWDVPTDPNFLTSCNRPYWHEAHHVVPNAEFRSAIAEVGQGTRLAPYYVKLIRGGLLKEKYNLNHMINMIILPMEKRIAAALGLPRHRLSSEVFSHQAYSNNVRTRLDEIFGPVQKEVQAHRSADYKACKTDVEALSEDLYGKIIAAGKKLGGGALEEIPGEELGAAPTPPPAASSSSTTFPS